MSPLALKDGERFLLIGDSITDCGRREECAPHGCGYAAMIQGLVCAVAPQLRIEYLNRGIGGNTVVDLEARSGEQRLGLGHQARPAVSGMVERPKLLRWPRTQSLGLDVSRSFTWMRL